MPRRRMHTVPALAADSLGSYMERQGLSMTVVIEDTSADGERVELALHGEAVKAMERGLYAPRARERAWRANPRCLHCDRLVPKSSRYGLLAAPEGHRVAHAGGCFLEAVAALNPTFSRRVAMGRKSVADATGVPA